MSFILAAAMILAMLASGEGHPSIYSWTVTKPSASVLHFGGAYITVPLDEDGTYDIDLDILYLHQSPFGPLPWVAHSDAMFSTVIFGDGFESGNINQWS